MTQNSSLSPSMTVNEAIRRFPRTVAVFSAAGIDACCGGALAIEEAARRHGLDVQPLLDQLARAISENQEAAATP